MRSKKIQARHLSDLVALQFVRSSDPWVSWWTCHQTVWPDVPEKVVLAKFRSLLRRGLVTGCACGCRGDFVLTAAGRLALETLQAKVA